VLDILEPRIAIHAVYNSAERESEHASTCQEGTRKEVLSKLVAWSTADDGHPVCWLEGPAGSGKSTILHSIAEQCDDESRLAFSFFFSRGKADRSDAAKVIPTFAYQLTESLPAIQQPLLHVLLKDHPFAPHLRLRDQLKKLIINPARSIHQTILPMIVIIDGLDECSDEDLLLQLIHVIVEATCYLPFRFLFASRPESRIRQTFNSQSIKPKSYFLSLRDFRAYSDVGNYLQRELTEVYKRNDDIMRGVPHPWPSRKQLEALVEKSEGLFIYVSTLIKYVGDRQGPLPQEKLQLVMTAHQGVDPLYVQVLLGAQEHSTHFHRVLGTIIYLHHPLTIHDLGQLLHLSSNHIRHALQGCQSIFVIPDTDQDSVRPYHASLKDFLSDMERAGVHFLNPKLYHISILVDCLQLISMVQENQIGQPLQYACQWWCHHLCLALLQEGTISEYIEQSVGNMAEQWLKTWMYGLNMESLKSVCESCESALHIMGASCIHNNLLEYWLIMLFKTTQQFAISMRKIQHITKVNNGFL
jgi:uridine kinase